MKAAIFTPTQRPGIDVTRNSLLRQKLGEGDELLWIVCDELFHKRYEVFREFAEEDKKLKKYDYRYFHLTKREGEVRNLARAYNEAMDYARDWNADIFISLQDYIYVPEYGVARFMQMTRDIDHNDDIPALFTGITSISSDPGDDFVKDLNGLYTIFKWPYNERPKELEWVDIRYRIGMGYAETIPIEFETNWACFPTKALYDDRLFYDEEFDKAVAYENQDYAYRAKHHGYRIIIDNDNQAISLPHKRYYKEEWAAEEPLTQVNRKLCEGRWGG